MAPSVGEIHASVKQLFPLVMCIDEMAKTLNYSLSRRKTQLQPRGGRHASGVAAQPIQRGYLLVIRSYMILIRIEMHEETKLNADKERSNKPTAFRLNHYKA